MNISPWLIEQLPPDTRDSSSFTRVLMVSRSVVSPVLPRLPCRLMSSFLLLSITVLMEDIFDVKSSVGFTPLDPNVGALN